MKSCNFNACGHSSRLWTLLDKPEVLVLDLKRLIRAMKKFSDPHALATPYIDWLE
jgi:hypothetical protein